MLRGLRQKSRRVAQGGVLAVALALTLPLAAEAGAGRTFVASNGNDTNTASNCAQTSPCQTFASAYTVTNIGGEIIALDGGGFGPLTITNSVRIVALQRAFVKLAPSSTGITINAGASGKVTLENIEINGAGGATTTGIALNSGHLILKNSILTQVSTGITVSGSGAANAKADIIDSEISYNSFGIFTSGTGVDPNNPSGGGNTEVRISGGNVIANTTAFFLSGPGVSATSTQNDNTILVRLSDNSSAAIPTNIVGNTTVAAGMGTGCTTAGNCEGIGTYESAVNFNQN